MTGKRHFGFFQTNDKLAIKERKKNSFHMVVRKVRRMERKEIYIFISGH